jgi:beta-lactamase regulating signal transducer with metallopeptidase domain
MSEILLGWDLPWIVSWLVRTALGGGVLLLACWWWQRRLRSVAQQQRLGEWSVMAALVLAVVSLFPAWLLIPVPDRRSPAPAPPVNQPVALASPDLDLAWVVLPDGVLDEAWPVAEVVAPPSPVETASTIPWWHRWQWVDAVLVLYGVVALVLLARWLLANVAVWWLLRKRDPISPALAELFAEMCWPLRCRLIVSDRVQVPFSVGLVRPTVVLPASLVEQATTEELRWVLAHELAHLSRQDTRSCWLFVFGQVVYFYLPWFWWLHRRVKLCQEYIADAAAVEWAGSPADYAHFLVSWAGRPVTGATGVSGSGSDLFRRVTMLLESTKPCDPRCSRPWVIGMAVSLLTLGLVVGGLGIKAIAAEDPRDPPADIKKEAPATEDKQPEPKKPDARKKDRPRLGNRIAIDELLKNLGQNLDDEQLKELRKKLEEAQKEMERTLKEFEKLRNLPGIQGGGMVFPGGPGGAAQWGPLGIIARRPTRLGAQIARPSKTLIDQLDLPKDQGIVLEEVGANSAAGKAGLKANDILLELAGKTVSSKIDEFVKMVDAIKANTPVNAVVMRKGKKETIKGLTLPEAKVAQGMRGFPMGPGGALFGGAASKGGSISIQKNNDEFTTKHSDGTVTITLKGTVDQGKAKLSEIVIDEGKGQKGTYDSIDKVPTTHRETVKKLAEMSATGSVRFPIK